MKALTAAEMREVDRLTTERFGVPSLQLMEAAGKSVCDYLLSKLGDAAAVGAAILCGKGNNGGDGFVVARLLQDRGLKPKVFLFANPETVCENAAANLAALRKSGADVRVVADAQQWSAAQAEVEKSRVIVDALLGTGLSGAVEGLLASVIEEVNKFSSGGTAVKPEMILAVDTPSGLPSGGEPARGPVIRAHATVTFTAPKIGQLVSKDAGCCGALLVREIGSPRELIEATGKSRLHWIEPGELRGLPLVRRADAHKGSYGHVLVIAGSLGKSGAAVLAGRGALRAGAGLVTVATPDVVLSSVATSQAELMTEPLPSTETGSTSLRSLEYERLATLLSGKTALAMGPGLSTHHETQQLVRTVLRDAALPVILDADGLNAFAGKTAELGRRKTSFLAITPHPGEFARLTGKTNDEIQADRLNSALRAAAEWNAFVILKGYHTVLATPQGEAFMSTTGNAGLAKGGSGDVLTGILAGLTAQFGTEDWARVLALGVYLHGLAAELATPDKDVSGLLAGEVAEAVPAARLQLIRELQQRG